MVAMVVALMATAACGRATSTTTATTSVTTTATTTTVPATTTAPVTSSPPVTTAPAIPLGPVVDRVYRVDAMNGWIAGYSYVAAVTDGRLQPVLNDRRVFGIDPIDRAVALAVVESDGGLSFGRLSRDGTFVEMAALAPHAADVSRVSIATSGDTVWLLAQMATSTQFSIGRLFVSTDGGARFVEGGAPAAGDIALLANGDAVLVGGVDDPSIRAQIFVTTDGSLWRYSAVDALNRAVDHLYRPTIIDSRLVVPVGQRKGATNDLFLRFIAGDSDSTLWTDVLREEPMPFAVYDISTDRADAMWRLRSEGMCQGFKTNCSVEWSLESLAAGQTTVLVTGRYPA